MNPGKKFERDFKKSVPLNVFYYRFKDGTAAYSKNDPGSNKQVRFQAKNTCDCMLFNGENLFMLELKSYKGKSLPFSSLRENQWKGLCESADYHNIVSGVIINFRDMEKTYFVGIMDLLTYKETSGKKSVPIVWCEKHGVEIKSKKIIVNYLYIIEDFLNTFAA